jgi:hypothetical protein
MSCGKRTAKEAELKYVYGPFESDKTQKVKIDETKVKIDETKVKIDETKVEIDETQLDRAVNWVLYKLAILKRENEFKHQIDELAEHLIFESDVFEKELDSLELFDREIIGWTPIPFKDDL